MLEGRLLLLLPIDVVGYTNRVAEFVDFARGSEEMDNAESAKRFLHTETLRTTLAAGLCTMAGHRAVRCGD